MGLTGRFDFRRKWTGKIVLRVDEEVPSLWSRSGERPIKRRWRNATLMDLASPELRTLMDLRMRPQYAAHHVEVERTPAAAANNVVPLQDPESPVGVPGTRARP
jgi:hypothetical protein